MNITVTFTDTGDPNLPDGSAVVFQDVDEHQLTLPADIEDIDCATARCEGCDAVHRRYTGVSRLYLRAVAHGSRPLWNIPQAAT